MNKNYHIIKFNQHLLLCIKLITENNVEESIMRFKIDKEIAYKIRKIPLLDWIKLIEQESNIFVFCDLEPKQIKRRVTYPDSALFRIEQILKN